MNLPAILPVLLGLAWLLPLASFTVIVLFGPRLGKHGKYGSAVATGAILSSFVLSVIALVGWVSQHPVTTAKHEAKEVTAVEKAVVKKGEAEGEHPAVAKAQAEEEIESREPVYYSGDWYTLVSVGRLKLTIGYYIDALTIAMFAMVTLIASCIHFYASGYMHEELHEVTDHEVTLTDGHHLHRPGRYPRFFQYLSLFCFSMLGLVVAGNIFMVFVFWELVGACSYFLIGFYVERRSASTAANKAFIVNRVGDWGMLIGLMALWGALGTFAFGDKQTPDGKVVTAADGAIEAPGIFSQVRPAEQQHKLITPRGMVLDDQPQLPAAAVAADTTKGPVNEKAGHWLLIVAGLGIFCGCVGKSAQFPLHVWLPDAMEGPTPVSALVHSATMVAAGVYLVGRFYPVFTPEVLFTIAIIGGITLLLAATIAIVAVDIKRVLAYSTISQLGYMMLALGVGGWLAGLFHLITHAFFKSLPFMCSGSVIHACHTNDMRKMGGLRHKMPWTAYTMLVGCLAIIGGGIPFLIGLSGYYSKDSIIAQALSFARQNTNPICGLLFYAASGGAAITAFYMFRLWYMTFAGKPRDHHVHEHAHESPPVMYVPLVVLAVFAVVIGWPIFQVPQLLEQARPAGTAVTTHGGVFAPNLVHPAEHLSHGEAIHVTATLVASATALSGFLLATIIYCWNMLNPEEIRRQFRPLYNLFWNKWYFDEIYQAIFIGPVMFISRRVADFDKQVIDRFINGLAVVVLGISKLDDLIDRWIVDGAVNYVSRQIYALAIAMRGVQTGRLRQYVMLIVVGTVALFVIVSFLWNPAWGAGQP